MDLAAYQEQAAATDQRPGRDIEDLTVHVLGLGGEAGSVAAEYKKRLRDGAAHGFWKPRMREELGDVLWYVATIATKLDLSLDDIASSNLQKTRSRWLATRQERFDAAYPEPERLPIRGSYHFVPTQTANGRPAVTVHLDGHPVGDTLTDAAHVEDGYRYHDAFHLSYAVLLGWSPVTRHLLRCKRKSIAAVDENEDGGRAIVIEEAVAALVWAYAVQHDLFEGITRLDQRLLDTIQDLVGLTEVGVRSASDWETAILAGYAVFRQLLAHGGGVVTFDADERSLLFGGQEPARR
jgi:NTP pyrophosphatase (non-canonical NTP hydrolase)